HGTAATLLAFVTYAVIQPAASFALRSLSTETMAKSSLASSLRPRVFYDDIPGTVVYVSDIPAGGGGKLQGVLYYQAPGRTGSNAYEQVVVSKEAYLRPSP